MNDIIKTARRVLEEMDNEFLFQRSNDRRETLVTFLSMLDNGKPVTDNEIYTLVKYGDPRP